MHRIGLPFSSSLYRRAHEITHAGVAELVDAPDLGSGIARCGGSSPFARTINIFMNIYVRAQY